jgi:3-phosphoshikimate 1-carboxyvinyltransferase
MADGASVLRGVLDADDTRHMRAALAQLGIRIERAEPDPDAWRVHGAGRRLGLDAHEDATIECGTAGTVARFLTAALVASGAAIRVDGSARMRERPMRTLFDALASRGAAFEFEGVPGALPVRLLPREIDLRGGDVELGELRSSQFVSALLIAAVWADAPTTLVLRVGTPARPYVDMTADTLRRFGATVDVDGDRITVRPGALRATQLDIEPDASAANYFLALAAIWGGQCTIDGMGRGSTQGDARFFEVLRGFGVDAEQRETSTSVTSAGVASLRGIAHLDLGEMPDMTLTAAVVAAFAPDPTRITGVGILRHHESDRIAAAAAELRKLGAAVEELEDGLSIVPPANGPRPGVAIETYDDHRMAMAFALVGDVVILEPRCVDKTFPRYFEVLAGLGVRSDPVETDNGPSQ